MKTGKSIDVLCVGHAAYDLTFLVDHHPGADEKCFASGFSSCGGGPAANAAVTVARLGGSSAFAGYLGNDFQGCRHLAELNSEGVNTELVVRGSHPTPLSVILVKPDGSRTVVNHKAETPFIEHGLIDFSRFRPKAILFDGHEPLISPALAEHARTRDIPVILDAGSVHRGTRDLAPVVGYLVASAKFARDFTGATDMRQSLNLLSGLSSCVVITLGEDGLVWKKGGRSGNLGAFPLEARDTTGAGDVFHGTFALGVARSMEFTSLLEYASAAAAVSCTRIGARKGIPSAEDVRRFLNP